MPSNTLAVCGRYAKLSAAHDTQKTVSDPNKTGNVIALPDNCARETDKQTETRSFVRP